jgi:chorismate mutase
MWNPPRYLVVETQALPQVFTQVVYAKHLIESGEVIGLAAAARKAGLSRSALYKYKDSVYVYDRQASDSVVSFHLVLRDVPGVLSAVLAAVSAQEGNILTINQNLPVAGLAPVSLTVALGRVTDLEVLGIIRGINGVEEAHRIQSR